MRSFLALVACALILVSPSRNPIWQPETPTPWDAESMVREALRVAPDTALDGNAATVQWARVLHKTGDPVDMQADYALMWVQEGTRHTLYAMSRTPRGRGVTVTWDLFTKFDAPFLNQRSFDYIPTAQDIRDFARDAEWYRYLTEAKYIIYAGDDAPPGQPQPPKDWDAEQILRESRVVNFDIGGPKTSQIVRWWVTEDGDLKTPNGTRVENAIIACTDGKRTTLYLVFRSSRGPQRTSWMRPSVMDLPNNWDRAFDHPPAPDEIDSFQRDVNAAWGAPRGWILLGGEVPLNSQ